jgi:hypothetical protein
VRDGAKVAGFQCDKVYYMAHRDLLVLAGRPVSGQPRAGWSVDLPREIKGPGWVPVHDVQTIPFKDGTEKFCLVLAYEVLTSAPLMEFSDLEGRVLDLRPG